MKPSSTIHRLAQPAAMNAATEMRSSAELLVRTFERNALLLPFGAVAFIVLIPAWIFESSGLETGLVFAWLGGSLFILGRWAVSTRPMPLLAGVVLGLGLLIRPELVIFSVAFLIGVLAMQLRHNSLRDSLQLVAAAAALPVAYQIFRMGYYGSLVSNPAVAKEASTNELGRGWDYLVDFSAPYWIWIPALVVVAGGYLPLVMGLRAVAASRGLVVVGVFVITGLVDALYIVVVGGDWIHARLLLPVQPLPLSLPSR